MSPGKLWQVRLFRALLHLYPKAFRDLYAEDMVELFQVRLAQRTEASTLAGSAFLIRSVVDLLVTAVAERRGRDGVSAVPQRLSTPTARPGEGNAVNNFVREIHHAARQLARTPLFSLAALGIVALGIGANAAAFTFVNAFLFRPPAWNEPERVVNIYQDSDDGEPNSTSFPAYLDMTAETELFSAVTASTPAGVTWLREGAEHQAAAEFVTASFLEVFGLKPFLGSWFGPELDHVGAGTAAVVNYRTWKAKLNGDPDIVGRVVTLNGEPVTILGVGPKSFAGNMMPVVTDFWLSISSVALGGEFRVGNLERRQDHWYDVKARMAPGVTPIAAQVGMDRLALRLEREFPQLNTGRDITVFPYGDVRLHPDADGNLKPAATAILGLVGLVLLLACSNLANLLLVRGLSRMPEVAMRRALGASRWQIARAFLVESLLLSMAGGALGTLLARWLMSYAPLLPLPTPAPGELDLSIDIRVLLFTFALVLVTGCLFALAPAMRAVSADLVSVLREGSRSASAGRRTAFLRNGLVSAQVAASFVLVILCALQVRNLSQVSTRGAGVDAEAVAYAEISLGPARLTPEENALLFQQIEQRARQLPGVASAALTTRLPANGRGGSSTTVIEGYEPLSGTGATEIQFSFVGAEYFETMGQPLLQGRAFNPGDTVDSPSVVIINQTAAQRYWGERGALGGRMRGESNPQAWVEVVGIVADAKVRSLAEAPTPIMYWPVTQAQLGRATLVLRALGPPEAVIDTAVREVSALRSGIDIGNRGVLEDFIRAGLAGPRMVATAFGGFALLALMLASLGIYAVVSFGVARRSSEIGIRVALGAARSSVIVTVLHDVLIAVGLGGLLGLGVSAVVATRMQGMLSGIEPIDLPSFLGGTLVLTAVAAAASYLPARRAAAADPVEALRAD